jgi:RNA polymerase sigma-70 factor, ECF subfamily
MEVNPATTDEQAMWRVHAMGDHDAFAELVRRWETPIQRLCGRMIGDLHKAEDLAQETFARVFVRRASYEPTGRFSTWLWRIAINLCHDELRRRTRRGEQSLQFEGADGEDGETAPVSPDATPSEELQTLEKSERIRAAVGRLPEKLRVVVLLRHYEGLKFAEIAEVLGIPDGTVKSRMVEGLDRLAVMLRNERI